MIARLGLALALLAGPAWAQAPACAIPDDLALTDLRLPSVQAAVASRHDLRILTVGGSSTAGLAAGGTGFTYPSLLADRLRSALPGITVDVTNRGKPAGSTRARVDRLPAELARLAPDLVIWAPGSSEAGMSEDIDGFVESLQEGLGRIEAAHADVILIDLQYAPSIARLINLSDYDAAIAGVANAADVPLLRRSELMHRWNDDGTLVLDGAPASGRVALVRRLFDCIATALADGIVKRSTAP